MGWEWPLPDVEALVWSRVKHLAPDITTWAVDAADGPGHMPWQASFTIQADVRGTSKQAAAVRARETRRAIYSLADPPWDGGVVTYVQVITGPFWMPDDDGTPRYVLRAEIRAHPRPVAPALLVRVAESEGTADVHAHD